MGKTPGDYDHVHAKGMDSMNVNNNRILWFMPPSGYSQNLKFGLEQTMRRVGISSGNVFYVSLQQRIDKPLLTVKGKKTVVFAEGMKERARNLIDDYIKTVKPGLIVINDFAALWLLTKNEKYTLNLCRGSMYVYNDVPCLVLDDLKNQHQLNHGQWVFINDMQKIARWSKGQQRREPRFEYQVARTVEDVRNFCLWLEQSFCIAHDTETRAGFITCFGYTGIVKGRIKTFVIPMFNPLKANNAHWDTEEEEIEVWEYIQRINGSNSIKILQNGSYDSSYEIRDRVPLVNYFIDTSHLWHSIYCEAPKQLNFISSLCLDYCRYWKDETKGDKEDPIGDNEASVERYWRYNALDCYNTFLDGRFLILLITQPKMEWALKNYIVEFELQIGPCLFAQMHGMKVDRKRQEWWTKRLKNEYQENLDKLRRMVDDAEFNPNSHDQVAQLVYDVLRANPVKTKGPKDFSRSADKNILRVVSEDPTNLPIVSTLVEAIIDVKEPLNNASKYGTWERGEDGKYRGMCLYNERFMYSLSAAATDTGRLGSSNHPFWIGTNAQNVPHDLRDIMVADSGFVLLEFDFSQSDAVFIAHESGDEKYIETMQRSWAGEDTHLIHASHFFKYDIETLKAAKKNKEEWLVGEPLGIRPITKRVVHGCNFQETAPTLLVQQMKRKGAIRAAEMMGAKKASNWSNEKLIAFIDRFLLKPFHKMYRGLEPWYESSKNECVRNGKKATCAFGRTRLFFGDVDSVKAVQRKLSAYYGQGGTAGNINRVMRYFFYSEQGRAFQRRGVYLILQVHDSLLFQLPPHIVNEFGAWIKEIMELRFYIKGRQLYVKAEGKIGYSWGLSMNEFGSGWEYKIEEAEKKVKDKYSKLTLTSNAA